MSANKTLPPGQRALDDFPRFGVTAFANWWPREPHRIELKITGAVACEATIATEWDALPRTTQRSDFHCVTTWSYRSIEWSGVRFKDFFDLVIAPLGPSTDASFIVLRCQDGYRTGMYLEDLLGPDVLLADRMNGAPLPPEHGAPVRLVAPAHYGYKNAKHLSRIELLKSDRDYRWIGPNFMDHPRARVAFEERSRGLPGWCYRYLYRPFVRPTVAKFKRAKARS